MGVWEDMGRHCPASTRFRRLNLGKQRRCAADGFEADFVGLSDLNVVCWIPVSVGSSPMLGSVSVGHDATRSSEAHERLR